MAILNRRGVYRDFDPTKMLEGEWAVVVDGDPNSERGRAVYMSFENGQVERMATYGDMVENVDAATTDIQAQLTQGVEGVISDAEDAVSQMQSDVADTISNANTTVAGYGTTINTALSGINDRMGAIEDDYQDLKDDNAAELIEMQGAVSTEIANTENTRLAAVEATANANEAAETVHRIIEGGGLVASVFGRSGIVTAQSGDYDSSQVTHGSGSVADALTFDTTPISQSTKAVTSGGVYTQINSINNILSDFATELDGKESVERIAVPSANGTAFKFSSGLMIAVKQVSLSAVITQASGSLYYSTNQLSFGDWPVAFATIPTTSYQLAEGSGDCFLGNVAGMSATSAGRAYIWRQNSSNNVNFVMNIIAIGLWE